MHTSACGFAGSRATLWPVTVVAVAAWHAANSTAGLLGAERFEDPENARTILLMAAGLVLLAVLVSVGTVWWWRTSKVEHPALGPLEVMGSRSWWRGDYTARRRRLDSARPAPEPGDGAAVAEAVDLGAVSRESPPQFDDLADVPPMVLVDAANGGDMADLDALLAAAGAAIAEVQVAQTSQDDVSASPDQVAAERPDAAAPVAVPAGVEPAAADDPTVAVEGACAPIDPLLRSPRTD